MASTHRDTVFTVSEPNVPPNRPAAPGPWDMSAWMAGPSKELRASPVGAEEEAPGKQPLASAFKGNNG